MSSPLKPSNVSTKNRSTLSPSAMSSRGRREEGEDGRKDGREEKSGS